MAKRRQARKHRAATAKPPAGNDGDEVSEEGIAAAPPMDAASILGHVAWLMAQSTTHRFAFVVDLERLVLAPVLAKQFKLYRKERIPLGYVSWAFLDEEAEERYQTHPNRLRPEDWTSGDRLWLIDIIAPFGGSGAIAKDLKEKVFPDRTAKALRAAKGGKGVRVVELHGAKAGPLAPDDGGTIGGGWDAETDGSSA